jgi:hypothetical protein
MPGGMNSPDTSAGGEPSASRPRSGDQIGTPAWMDKAVQAVAGGPGTAEREIARWENEGGRVRYEDRSRD